MMEARIYLNKNLDHTVWEALKQVPGLSDPMVSKICTLFQIPRNFKIKKINKSLLNKIEYFVSKNFFVGYKVIRQISTAVTTRFLSKTRRGIRSRRGLPINGQRSHSNGKTSRRLRGHWVLPEVLKNPVAFLRMHPESKKKQRLLSSLAHLNLKPRFRPLHLKKKRTKYKKPLKTFKKNKNVKNR